MAGLTVTNNFDIFATFDRDVSVGTFDIIASFGLSGHIYADDSQLHINVPASESQKTAAHLAACVEGLDQ